GRGSCFVRANGRRNGAPRIQPRAAPARSARPFACTPSRGLRCGGLAAASTTLGRTGSATQSLVSRLISSRIIVSARVGTTSQTTCSTTSRESASTPATCSGVRPRPARRSGSEPKPLPEAASGGRAPLSTGATGGGTRGLSSNEGGATTVAGAGAGGICEPYASVWALGRTGGASATGGSGAAASGGEGAGAAACGTGACAALATLRSAA